jgi:multidrug efflux pump subunit AcrA (membrane-fusion protein)
MLAVNEMRHLSTGTNLGSGSSIRCSRLLFNLLGLGVYFALFEFSASVTATELQPEIVVENAVLKTIESTTVASRVGGVIATFEAKEGMMVGAGQTLGKIEDEAVCIELDKLKTAVAVARKKFQNDIDQRLASKSLAVAENEYQRAMNANRQVEDTYPINEIDRLRLISDRAKLEVERALYLQRMAALEVRQAENEYRKSFEIYTRHKINSPVDGVIVSIEKRVGEWVEPGTALFRMVRIDRLRIEGFVDAEQCVSDLVGREARVTVDLAGKPFKTLGTVTFVNPDVNSVNNQVRIHLEVDNSDHMLRPGLRVNTSILPAP